MWIKQRHGNGNKNVENNYSGKKRIDIKVQVLKYLETWISEDIKCRTEIKPWLAIFKKDFNKKSGICAESWKIA